MSKLRKDYLNKKLIMAPWSSGQDTTLSRWYQGFDSPRGHHKLNLEA